MPTDIIMPQMGESIVEGTITKWLKKPGDKVQRDEPLFEISTDKVDAEIPAPASGVLQEIKVAEGTTVGINTVVGTISADGEAAAPAKGTPASGPFGCVAARARARSTVTAVNAFNAVSRCAQARVDGAWSNRTPAISNTGQALRPGRGRGTPLPKSCP